MRKLLAVVIVLILLAGAAAAGAIWYVRPAERLDLTYEPVPFRARALDMARRLSAEMELTEADVGNLAKQSLAEHPVTDDGNVITGARFTLAGDRLVACVNVRLKDRVPAELRLVYRMEWREPVLTAAVEEAKLKDVSLPIRFFDDVDIPLGDEVPKPLHVKSVRIEGGRLVVEFRKPTLQELGDLLKGKGE